MMDHGSIATFGNDGEQRPQISFAGEGGSGTPASDISIEVEDLEGALARMQRAGREIVYGPATEPWGVRRFFVKDPFGKLVNILVHL